MACLEADREIFSVINVGLYPSTSKYTSTKLLQKVKFYFCVILCGVPMMDFLIGTITDSNAEAIKEVHLS